MVISISDKYEKLDVLEIEKTSSDYVIRMETVEDGISYMYVSECELQKFLDKVQNECKRD